MFVITIWYIPVYFNYSVVHLLNGKSRGLVEAQFGRCNKAKKLLKKNVSSLCYLFIDVRSFCVCLVPSQGCPLEVVSLGNF